MPHKKHYPLALILVASLLLTGFEGFQCSKEKDSDSDGGSTGTRIQVRDEQKISATQGNFNGRLEDGDRFGSAVADIGDLEADGVRDLAVGTPFDDTGGINRGAAWILFMDSDGNVDQEQKITGTLLGLGLNLNDNDQFGSAVAGIGDLDGDGAFDLAVGTPGGDGGGIDRGEVWVLFLDDQGKVRDENKITDLFNLDLRLNDDDRFGSAVATIGDVNGDGITDLAVGAPNDDTGADNAGAVWILFMNTDGTVDSSQKIARLTGGFTGTLRAGDNFGAAVAGIGDLDNDGIPDLAVGVPGADTRGTDRGAVWILFLNADGKVLQEQEIAERSGGFDASLSDDDRFGSALAVIGDMNADGITDLAVGAPNDDDGADNAGAVWVLLLDTNGGVDGWQKVSSRAGNFGGRLKADDNFGAAIAGTGNLDSSELNDIAVGAPGDDEGGVDKGAVWILFMESTTSQ